MAGLTRPHVLVRPEAHRAAAPGERIVSFTFPCGARGLISLHTDVHGTPYLHVYQHDPEVKVCVTPPEGGRVLPEGTAGDAVYLVTLGPPKGGR